jgi:hypothetical protein
MNRDVVAVVIREGSRFISQWLVARGPGRGETETVQSPPEETTVSEASEQIATTDEEIQEGVACIPCVNSHAHACLGLLAEANRMSPDELNADSMVRVDKCLGEIAAAERIDLAEENIRKLPPEEQVIARHAKAGLRDVRHILEGLKTTDELRDADAMMAELQKHVGTEWFKYRLAKAEKERGKDDGG